VAASRETECKGGWIGPNKDIEKEKKMRRMDERRRDNTDLLSRQRLQSCT